jgi:polyferredoxin
MPTWEARMDPATIKAMAVYIHANADGRRGSAGIAGRNLPDQAVLVDFAGGRFYFFFIEIWPQEVYYLTGLLVGRAGAVPGDALFGRLWCGYACPQTVWTDLFIAVERWSRATATRAHALDKAPMAPTSCGARAASTPSGCGIALATGGAWVFYFADAPTLARDLLVAARRSTAYVFRAS